MTTRQAEVATALVVPEPLTLWGRGILHRALDHRLRRHFALASSAPNGSDAPAPMIVAAADTLADFDDSWVTVARERRAVLLPVQGELDRISVGPLLFPNLPGCRECLRRRRASAAPDAKARAELDRRCGDEVARTPSPLLCDLIADCAAATVVDETQAWAAGRTPRSQGAVLVFQPAGLSLQRHRLFPDPLCPACGGLPDDEPSAVIAGPAARPKLSPASLRTRELNALEPELMASYVDDEMGVISSIHASAEYALPVVSARVHPTGASAGEQGYGRTLDFRAARLTAIAEALERMGGMSPRGKRTVVHASRRDLGARALDPTCLGLYPAERHAIAGFPFLRYHDDLALDWVWGYSFGRRQPILVPESYAYYRTDPIIDQGVDRGARTRSFVYEISNGCAIGSCMEEAIVHGLLEVAERDAFLMTWLAQMSVPRLDPESARDRRIPQLLERTRRRTGYDVLVFDITVEYQLPCFWVMAVDPSEHPDRPRALCAAGSAIDPERGVFNALQELTTFIDARLASYPSERGRAESLVQNPSLVRQMADHGLLYSHPDAFSRFDFLLRAPRLRRFSELDDTWRWPRYADLTDDLREMVARFLAVDLDVVVVDQTTLEHRACGFSCVKVIVPGALPMTFGHDARRVDGLPRLYEVPQRLGHRSARLHAAEVNPHPHPFP
jgi:ribosomal protein S12 methylthiotransferase accessory factor